LHWGIAARRGVGVDHVRIGIDRVRIGVDDYRVAVAASLAVSPPHAISTAPAKMIQVRKGKLFIG
jgi:hypothetical protein